MRLTRVVLLLSLIALLPSAAGAYQCCGPSGWGCGDCLPNFPPASGYRCGNILSSGYCSCSSDAESCIAWDGCLYSPWCEWGAVLNGPRTASSHGPQEQAQPQCRVSRRATLAPSSGGSGAGGGR